MSHFLPHPNQTEKIYWCPTALLLTGPQLVPNPGCQAQSCSLGLSTPPATPSKRQVGRALTEVPAEGEAGQKMKSLIPRGNPHGGDIRAEDFHERTGRRKFQRGGGLEDSPRGETAENKYSQSRAKLIVYKPRFQRGEERAM